MKILNNLITKILYPEYHTRDKSRDYIKNDIRIYCEGTSIVVEVTEDGIRDRLAKVEHKLRDLK